MPTNKQHSQQYLKDFDFRSLFIEELGWDRYTAQPLYISVDQQTYKLRGIVEKRGVVVYICDPDTYGAIPDSLSRRKIEKEVTKFSYEHIIIYIDAKREHQVWQWTRREPGKPTAIRETSFSKKQTGEALLQKLPAIAFELNEEEQLTTTHVTGRVRQAFDVDRVTKRFYDRFSAEHTAFLKFIEGITSEADREWYASLMLNRLMFIYFIQKKGFLDGDIDYLPNRLRRIQERKSSSTFLSFYRHFLLRLFHEGLGKQEHSPELDTLLGKVPYLNGGLFDVHELECDNPDIQIPDEAFERIFNFFDAYNWHLDERPLRNDNEINPDVLGYIFEKYINQKQMGAYYTKEDITEYISKNTIIPFLFEAAQEKCEIAFQPDGALWRLLRDDPDRYFYATVKRGIELRLPPEIEAGLDDVSQRTEWNKPAPEEYGLPTETWRELVARRKRYEEVRAKLEAGEVHSINDLITYNLDIRQFAQDAIENCEGPDLLRAFYQSIEQVTVLDPTCGSGAFLFAALNVLEPLYEACLDRMQSMVSDRDRINEYTEPHGRKLSQQSLTDFRGALKQIEQHPNRRYFILKSIIINNLFGVDIMEEATEICKLRLFLKLVAQIEQVEDIEPLPDIDFNIRAGNTLVGFASYNEVEKAIGNDLRNSMISGETMRRIEQKAQEIERGFDNFRKLQTQFDIEAIVIDEMKQQLRSQLKELNAELDRFLAGEYGIDPNNVPIRKDYEEKFERWQQNYQPFHWFVEFYGIMKNGGFDVIIGNPPYVEYEQVSRTYKLANYTTLSTGNLYALTMERCVSLLAPDGRFGMIVPSSATCTDGYLPLQKILLEQSALHISSYSDQRGKLFDIPHPRLCIITYQKGPTAKSVFSTPYLKLGRELRDYLFQRLEYIEVTHQVRPGIIPRYDSPLEYTIHTKLHNQSHRLGDYICKTGSHKLYYTRKLSWFVQVTPFIPQITDEQGRLRNPSELKTLLFSSSEHADIAFVALNSNLFYWFITTGSDCRNLNMREVLGLPLSMDQIPITIQQDLRKLASELAGDLQARSELRKMSYKDIGMLAIQCVFPSESRPIIDEIDHVLAQHYGFTDEELDFIINYDIKYRMGRDIDAEEEIL